MAISINAKTAPKVTSINTGKPILKKYRLMIGSAVWTRNERNGIGRIIASAFPPKLDGSASGLKNVNGSIKINLPVRLTSSSIMPFEMAELQKNHANHVAQKEISTVIMMITPSPRKSDGSAENAMGNIIEN